MTGLVAKQQTCGIIQLPLNNLAITALDYVSRKGIATAIGHAPAAGIINPSIGSVLSIAEALTNIIWAPIEEGIRGVSLSANWMWPCRHKGEDARLYAAVTAASDFALALGINIPTGKDSLSMTQKYRDGTEVFSPGTVIISAAGEVTDFRKAVEPVISDRPESHLLYIDLSCDEFKTGGSSFSLSMNCLGNDAPQVKDPSYFAKVFDTVQQFIRDGEILAGHDISAGGMIVAFLELCFTRPGAGLKINLDSIPEKDILKILFSENPGILIQIRDSSEVEPILKEKQIKFHNLGHYAASGSLDMNKAGKSWSLPVEKLRDTWFKTSYLLDRNQCGTELAKNRFVNYKKQPLHFEFPGQFAGKLSQYGINPKRIAHSGIRSAIIREKGVNGDREMAFMMYLAGFDVRDVHMTDLISGRESLDDINLIVFVGGFSNSDVLGSAKGWAGAFLYNEKARETLNRYYARKDTLSLGVCNGCQLMVELDLVVPGHAHKPKMSRNTSHKFESSFLSVQIPDNRSVMFRTMAGSTLGIWVAHGEGHFNLPYGEKNYNVSLKFTYPEYPGNPNGSDYAVAGICSDDGRHLAIMPHLERSIYPWNWAYYPEERKNDEVSPWIEAFVNAIRWIRGNQQQ